MPQLGPIHIDRDSVLIGQPHPGQPARWDFWGIHVEHPWSPCVTEHDAPRHIYLHAGPLGSLTIALPARTDGHLHLDRATSWSPTRGWAGATDRIIAYTPDRWMTCRRTVGDPVVTARGATWQPRCSAHRHHLGPCVAPT